MRSLAALSLLAAVVAAQPVTYPLPASTGSTTATELTAPYLVPSGVTQSLVTSRSLLGGLPASFRSWDMIAVSPDSRHIFVPCEVSSGAGVFRYDTLTGNFAVLMIGNGTGIREADPAAFDPLNDDFSRLDPATLSPHGTVVTAEERTGGRMFEVTNPYATGAFSIRWLSKVPASRHEGLRFDTLGSMYFVDEDGSGSLYKYVPAVAGDLSVGQTFVLSVNGFNGNPSWHWDTAVNLAAPRTGLATWVPMTDINGNALTAADPFAFVSTTGGRAAADELGATPYGQLEDLAVNVLASGNECVYVSASSENTVYSVELLSSTAAMVRVFVNYDTVNLATGMDVNPAQNSPTASVGSGTTFDDPDNLAVDHFGTIYVVEDAEPGDIWKAVDADRDGVAEAMGMFASLGVSGAEPSGLIADPRDPYRFYSCTLHPSSDNDAIFRFDTRPFPGTDEDAELLVGVNGPGSATPGEFVASVYAGNQISILLHSPRETLRFRPFVIAFQGRPQGTPVTPTIPNFYFDLGLPIVYTVNPSLLSTTKLPLGGFQLVAILPPGLAGTALRVQGGIVTPTAANGVAAATDAYDLMAN